MQLFGEGQDVSRKQDRSDKPPRSVRYTADGSLPDDVRDAIIAAGQVAERLAADGRQLHFAHDPASGAVVIEVQDLDGNVLGTIPPTKVLELAAGAPLEF
jgi:flagellar protein FlaG